MADTTFELLDEISATINDTQSALATLTRTFNDTGLSNPIIYHLRLLASSYLEGNAETYHDFVQLAGGVQEYRTAVLERHGKEIEEMGIVLLVNMLLKPAGFVLEIAYLDRSLGDQVNKYRFPAEANTHDPAALGPVIYLLYRPDHYDILYRAPLEIQVHNAMAFSQAYEIAGTTPSLGAYSGMDVDTLSLIPGYAASGSGLAPLAESPMPSYTAPGPQPTWSAVSYPSAMVAPTPSDYGIELQINIPGSMVEEQAAERRQAAMDNPLRFTKYNVMPLFTNTNLWRDDPCKTNIFKNTHFNVAHFNNPRFQPEEYKPDASEDGEVALHPKGRKKPRAPLTDSD
jgi:ubiquitin thioesterase protein OTUB1